jgi:hypothetical protein
MALAYAVNVGSLRFANEGRDAKPLLALETELGIGGSGGRCRIQLGDPSWGDPSLGDPIAVELDNGDGATKVFSGEVEAVERRSTSLWIHGRDGLAKLARTEVEAVYEETAAGEIIEALIGAAGAEAGEIEQGPTFPSYVVHRGPRALRHAQKLAELIGAELSTDGEGKVHFKLPSAGGSADHRLAWGVDLLDLSLERALAQLDSLVVWGEGAAASQGTDKNHWLPSDLSGVTGKAKIQPGASAGQAGSVASGSSGELVRTVFDGAVREASVAEELARAQALRVALRPMIGHVLVLGHPEIQAGEWVELADLPSGSGPSAAPTLRVLRVIHQFALGRGLLTRLEF